VYYNRRADIEVRNPSFFPGKGSGQPDDIDKVNSGGTDSRRSMRAWRNRVIDPV